MSREHWELHIKTLHAYFLHSVISVERVSITKSYLIHTQRKYYWNNKVEIVRQERAHTCRNALSELMRQLMQFFLPIL